MEEKFVGFDGKSIGATEVKNRETVAAGKFVEEVHAGQTKDCTAECFCNKKPGDYVKGTGLKLCAKLSKNDKYFLARYPGQQGLHAVGCPFGEPISESKGKRSAAIIHADGFTNAKVTVKFKLGNKKAVAKRVPRIKKHSSKVTGRNSCKQQGMLEVMMCEAGLNLWIEPAKRTNASTFTALQSVAEKWTVNNAPLLNNFMLFDAETEHCTWENKRDELKGLSNKKSRAAVLVLAEVMHAERTVDVWKLKLLKDSPMVELSEEMSSHLSEKFPSAFARLKQCGKTGNCHVFALVLISVDMAGVEVVEHISLQLMSRDFIPVRSFKEVKLANAAVKNKRKFMTHLLKIKGFRFVPDFEFLDVGYRCFFEVFGYSSEDYQKTKGIKIDYWEDKKIFLKHWDGKGRVPNLPTKDEAAEYHEKLRQAKKSKRAGV